MRDYKRKRSGYRQVTLVTLKSRASSYPFQKINIRPHRLAVRTTGFHPVNQGSIPCGVTN